MLMHCVQISDKFPGPPVTNVLLFPIHVVKRDSGLDYWFCLIEWDIEQIEYAV